MREIEIERLLHWAYRDELPKRGIGDVANDWERVSRYGELLTVIDDEPGFPVIMGPPHPDALTIERAVQGLHAELQLAWPDYRMLIMADMPALAPTDSPLGSLVFSEVALVEAFARMGQRPRWDLGRPRPRRILGRNHKPVIIGTCEGGRYSAGAGCPLQWFDPTLEAIAFRRAEYLVWRGALDRLVGTLRGWLLRDHVPLEPDAPSVPWLDGPAVATPAPVPGVAAAWRTWQDAKPVRSKGRQRFGVDAVPDGA